MTKETRWARVRELVRFVIAHEHEAEDDEEDCQRCLDAVASAFAVAVETEQRRCAWLHHGCPPVALYGDDGEMQCSNIERHRPLDFKREPLLILTAELRRT